MSFAKIAVLSLLCFSLVSAAQAPHLVEKDGRYALLVDGKPFLVLGGQIHNSSAWPSELPQVWKSMETLHANTIEAPVYWEQVEAEPSKFDYTNVDAIVKGAREHNLYVILLWFGTWKNGNMHYAPAWVKADTAKYPRIIRPDGAPIDVLSPLSRNTLDADKAAFTALMRHVAQIDAQDHTVIAVQVENESGNIGSIRDNSPEANKLIAGQVPDDLLKAANKTAGTWHQVFGSEADEIFQAYYQAKYINEITAAGKHELNIPMYLNVWIDYPAAQLPQRQLDQPGIGYPSGGPVQKLVGVWRKLAPSIDMIGPDIYSDDPRLYHEVVSAYHRNDNALWIPETGRSDGFAKYFFYALGQGAICFSPFGVDQSGWNITGDEPWTAHARNFALASPIDREIAQLQFDGHLKAAMEERGQPSQEIDFGSWQATGAYGFPQQDGRPAPGTKDAHGGALIAQLGRNEFLVTGIDASIIFHLPGKLPWIRSQFVSAEEGGFENGVWKTTRLLNGDETDRGLTFHTTPVLVKVKMQRF